MKAAASSKKYTPPRSPNAEALTLKPSGQRPPREGRLIVEVRRHLAAAEAALVQPPLRMLRVLQRLEHLQPKDDLQIPVARETYNYNFPSVYHQISN